MFETGEKVKQIKLSFVRNQAKRNLFIICFISFGLLDYAAFSVAMLWS